jgi:hypothetical protein
MRRAVMLCSVVLTVAACATPGEYHGVTIPATPGEQHSATARAKTVAPPPDYFWHYWGH